MCGSPAAARAPTALAATGKLRITIDSEIPPAEAPAAIECSRSGHACGKSVSRL
ncbi:zinc-binding dehydrogenase [Streptomyces sp. NPDC001401]|uniref:zinc-binding dehydrogenase n=1 Tax=Streptomyces sp. NPDC001401 TaxID=3364570 RepID=UPI00369F64CC